MDKMVLKALQERAGVHIDGNYVKSLLGWRPWRLRWEKVVD
jgi:hypothetical protein